MQNSSLSIEEKISLRKLFYIYKKRSKLIWFVTALFILSGLIYVLTSKPVYEIKALIEIGQIYNQPIDNIHDRKQKLLYQYNVNTKNIKRELPYIKSISISKKSTSILILNIHTNNKQEGKEYIQTIVNKIETEYKEITDPFQENQKSLIEIIESNIKESTKDLLLKKEELNQYHQKLVSLKGDVANLAGIYVIKSSQLNTELHELTKYISELKTIKQELKLSITPVKMKPTNVVGDIVVFDKPIKPQKSLIIIVTLIAGLMFSVFLAFFLEFLKSIKKEEDVTN